MFKLQSFTFFRARHRALASTSSSDSANQLQQPAQIRARMEFTTKKPAPKMFESSFHLVDVKIKGLSKIQKLLKMIFFPNQRAGLKKYSLTCPMTDREILQQLRRSLQKIPLHLAFHINQTVEAITYWINRSFLVRVKLSQFTEEIP